MLNSRSPRSPSGALSPVLGSGLLNSVSRTTMKRFSQMRWSTFTASLALVAVLVLTVLAAPSIQAQNYSVLYSFRRPKHDGFLPASDLLLGKSGNLYGTTITGGVCCAG